jgi:hypothetical protein
MALVNAAWREGVFVPPGAEPGLTNGFPWRDAIEARTAKQVARQRFNYPTADQQNWKAFTNLPDRTLGVRDGTGATVFPDVVVIDAPTTEVMLVAEIETVRSLTEDLDLAEKWRAFASIGPLYLFVPMSEIDKGRAAVRAAKVTLAGLRTWRYMAGMDFTDIVDVPV